MNVVVLGIAATVALALALAEFGDEEQNLFRMAISEAAGLPGEKVYLLEVDSFVARRSGSTRIRLAVQADNPRHAEAMLPSLQLLLHNALKYNGFLF